MCAILLPIAFALTAAAPQFVTALRGFLTGYIGVFSLAILYAERLYLIATGADEEMAAHSVAVGALSRQPSALHRMHSMPVSQPHAADAADIELAVSASASALSPKSKLSASSASAAAAAQPRKPRELSSARVRRSSNFFASNRNQLQGSAGCADASSSSSSSSSSGARPSLMLRSSVFQQQAGIAAGAMGAGSSSVSVGGSGLITAQRFDAFATEMRAAHSQLRRSLRGALQETRADHRVNAAFRAELARLLPVAAAAAHTALECGRDGHGHGAHGDRSNGSAADESDDDEGDDDQSGIWLKTAPLEQTSELKSAAPCSDRSTAPSPAQHVTLNLTSLRESASEQSAATLNARLAEQEAPTTSRQPPSVESVLRKFMTLNSNAAKPTPDIALASPSDARKDARALNGSDAAAKISQRASASPLRAPLSVQTVSPLLAPAALSLELPPMSLPSPFALASSARGSAESQTVASMPQALRRQESTALAPSSSTASLSSSSSSASLRASATNLRGVSASAVPDSALSAMLTTLTQWHASPVDTSAGTSASGRGNDDRSGSAFSGAKQP